MIVVIGFLGLALDVGYLQVMRMRAQVAADAGALAAGHKILNGNTSEITNSARNDASLNGFTNGVNGVTITVNHPPTRGSRTGDNNFAEVIVAKDYATFFMRLFGINSVNVKARAVGRPGSSPTCLYALDPTSNESLKAAADAVVQMTCGILVESNNTDKALFVKDHACLSDSAIGVVGNFKNESDCPTGINPTPTTGIDTFSDPLAYLTRPTVGACNYTDYKADGKTVTLNPGVYCKGIELKNSTVTMNVELYIVNGYGFRAENSTVTGTGVTIFSTNGAADYKKHYLYGSAVQLTAPTSGTYTGILYYQDPNVGAGEDSEVNGDSSTKLEGALHFPTTKLKFKGGSSGASRYLIMVAKRIELSGHAYLDNDYG